MSPQRLNEVLKNYRSRKARYTYLQETVKTIERWLAICKGEMINDMVSLSQALSGMPHGSGVGDPTGRLGLDIASGEVSPFVKQAEKELKEIEGEIQSIGYEIKVCETIFEALGDREREVMILKIVDDRDWKYTLAQMNDMHNNSYSKRSLQRLLERALDKAYEIVK